MTFTTDQLTAFWDIKDVESLDYIYEPFNDNETKEHWKQQYNLEFSTGLQADYRSIQPPWTNKILEQLTRLGYNLTNPGTSFYKMLPGDILPYHSDTFARYSSKFKVAPESVSRIIVFLQDWQPGFLFEIDGVPIYQYSAGQFVHWKYNVPHMAGNLGSVPRYTLQITGVIQ